MNNLEEFVAAKLLQIKAIKIQSTMPFTWVTGWRAPIYCDNRKILSYPSVRNIIRMELARLVVEKYPQTEVIASVATNAIAMGMLVAEELGLPFVYVHPTPKRHGLENQIEGDLRPRQNVIVIEDQVSIGDNCLKVVDVLRRNGGNVQGVVSIFHYEFADTQKKAEQAQVKTDYLCGFNAAISQAKKINYISEDEVSILQSWHANPSAWKE